MVILQCTREYRKRRAHLPSPPLLCLCCTACAMLPRQGQAILPLFPLTSDNPSHDCSSAPATREGCDQLAASLAAAVCTMPQNGSLMPRLGTGTRMRTQSRWVAASRRRQTSRPSLVLPAWAISSPLGSLISVHCTRPKPKHFGPLGSSGNSFKEMFFLPQSF